MIWILGGFLLGVCVGAFVEAFIINMYPEEFGLEHAE